MNLTNATPAAMMTADELREYLKQFDSKRAAAKSLGYKQACSFNRLLQRRGVTTPRDRQVTRAYGHLTKEDIHWIFELSAAKLPRHAIAGKFEVSKGLITQIINGDLYKRYIDELLHEGLIHERPKNL